MEAKKRKEEMEALWAKQQEKLRQPSIIVADSISKRVILEENEFDSLCDLQDEDTYMTTGGFEKDLDLNE